MMAILRKHQRTRGDCEHLFRPNVNTCMTNTGTVTTTHSIVNSRPTLNCVSFRQHIDDAFAANGPHIQDLLRYRMDFIIGARPGSNAALFDEVCERLNGSECTESAPDDLNIKVSVAAFGSPTISH